MSAFTLTVLTALVAFITQASAAAVSSPESVQSSSIHTPAGTGTATAEVDSSATPYPTVAAIPRPVVLSVPAYMRVEAANPTGGLWEGYGPNMWDFAFNGTNYTNEPFNVMLYASTNGTVWQSSSVTKTLACNARATGVPMGDAFFYLTSVSPYVVKPTESLPGAPSVTCTPTST